MYRVVIPHLPYCRPPAHQWLCRGLVGVHCTAHISGSAGPNFVPLVCLERCISGLSGVTPIARFCSELGDICGNYSFWHLWQNFNQIAPECSYTVTQTIRVCSIPVSPHKTPIIFLIGFTLGCVSDYQWFSTHHTPTP